jgi:hypothetical protein
MSERVTLVDTRKWMAGKLAPKKYGDHLTPDVKGNGLNFQTAILIEIGGEPETELDVSPAPEAGGGVLLEGDGAAVRGSGRRR